MVGVDLNADVGEGAGTDAELMPFLSSANIACGGHAGDEGTMRATIALAARHGVVIGAHPGYPDRAGFGRLPMGIAPDLLEASLVEQIAALVAMAGKSGIAVRHVKPHGALYNEAARDLALAMVAARAVGSVSADLVLVGLAGGALLEAGRALGLRVAAEAFADRAYEPDGSLRSRSLPGAVLDPAAAALQATSIARDSRVRTSDGTWLSIPADTLCIHGDTPGAAHIARAVRTALLEAGIEVRA
ncbi:MAG: LamB/YcsF family protein [Chloroflexi bacterium]|nr:LamB/YcsF family protein [Chloroflexota bacterium]